MFTRALVSAVALVGFVATSAHADTMKNCAAAWDTMTAADKAKTTYKTYSSMCLKTGYTVPASGAMMSAAPPAGATGQCKDGSYTMSKTHSGACSHHGGVAKWL